MDTIFMNSENSKISYSHKLLLNFTDKIALRSCEEEKLFIKSEHMLYMGKYKKHK